MRWLAFLIIVLFPLTAPAEPGPKAPVRLDIDGDILPVGAIARLGSKRFREINATRIALTADGTAAICSDDSSVRVWDLTTGKQGRAWPLPEDFFGLVSRDGRQAVHLRDGAADVWDVHVGKRTCSLEVGDNVLWAAALSTDGSTLATIETIGRENLACVWDLRTQKSRVVARGRAGLDNVWFADGDRTLLLWHEEEKKVRGIDLTNDAEVYCLRNVRSVFAIPGGARCFSSHGPGGSKLFAAATGRELARGPDPAHYGYFEPISLSSDGLRFAFQTGGDVVVRDFRDGKKVTRCRIEGVIAAFGRKSELAIMSHDGLHVFDADTGRRLGGPEAAYGLPRLPAAFGWLADGKTVTAVDDQAQRIWFDAATGAVLRRASWNPWPPTARIPTCSWPTPKRDLGDGWAVSGASETAGPYLGWFDPVLPLFAARRQEAADTKGYEPPYRFTVAPGPDRIHNLHEPVSTRGPREVAMYDRHTCQLLWKIYLPGPVDLGFTPDGLRLATLEQDQIRIWDVVTGEMLLCRPVPIAGRPPSGFPAGRGLAFSPDGRQLAVGDWDGTILIWDVAVPEAAAPPLPVGDLPGLWNDLRAADPKVGWRAAFRLASRQEETIPFLIERLHPVRPLTEDEWQRLLTDLDAPMYRKREATMRRVLDLGDAAEPFVRAALKDATTAELRKRLEDLHARMGSKDPPRGNDLQQLRAIFVLERAATKEARAKIAELATGLPGARVTLQAKQANERLAAIDPASRKD